MNIWAIIGGAKCIVDPTKIVGGPTMHNMEKNLCGYFFLTRNVVYKAACPSAECWCVSQSQCLCVCELYLKVCGRSQTFLTMCHQPPSIQCYLHSSPVRAMTSQVTWVVFLDFGPRNGSPMATNVVLVFVVLLGVVVSTKAFSFHNRSSPNFAHR